MSFPPLPAQYRLFDHVDPICCLGPRCRNCCAGPFCGEGCHQAYSRIMAQVEEEKRQRERDGEQERRRQWEEEQRTLILQLQQQQQQQRTTTPGPSTNNTRNSNNTQREQAGGGRRDRNDGDDSVSQLDQMLQEFPLLDREVVADVLSSLRGRSVEQVRRALGAMLTGQTEAQSSATAGAHQAPPSVARSAGGSRGAQPAASSASVSSINDQQCGLCFTRPLTIVFNPCGHQCCEECVAQLNNVCPWDRRPIQNAISRR